MSKNAVCPDCDGEGVVEIGNGMYEECLTCLGTGSVKVELKPTKHFPTYKEGCRK